MSLLDILILFLYKYMISIQYKVVDSIHSSHFLHFPLNSVTAILQLFLFFFFFLFLTSLLWSWKLKHEWWTSFNMVSELGGILIRLSHLLSSFSRSRFFCSLTYISGVSIYWLKIGFCFCFLFQYFPCWNQLLDQFIFCVLN